MVLGINRATSLIEGNYINFSRLYEYESSPLCCDDVSIKYVLTGKETYEVEKTVYPVSAGNYLLINKGSCHIEQLEAKQLNEGLCIHLSSDLIRQSYYAICHSDDHLLSYPEENSNVEPELLENVYGRGECSFFTLLQQLGKRIEEGKIMDFGEDHYFQLADTLVQSQMRIFRQIGNIKAKTAAVQKELFKRAETAKMYIDENLFNPLTISEIAAVAHLSPFHFMRIFKQVYRKAPYQYIVQARLDTAHLLLMNQTLSITEVAESSGFCDLYSFSKSFKNRFGIAPSQIAKVNSSKYV